jgi:serine/threonine-protein phosphatase PP1 catalytic subunit
MSVSSELLCSFELLKPLDSSALKSHIKKGNKKRQHILNSPVGDTALYLMRYSADFS